MVHLLLAIFTTMVICVIMVMFGMVDMLCAYSLSRQNHIGKIYGVMDDLRTEHPRVQNKLIAMTNALIASADVDGIRMDTRMLYVSDHIILAMQNPLSFFQAWAPAVRNYAKTLGKDNFFIFGEFFCTMNR